MSEDEHRRVLLTDLPCSVVPVGAGLQGAELVGGLLSAIKGEVGKKDNDEKSG